MTRALANIALTVAAVGAILLGGVFVLRSHDKRVAADALGKKEISSLDSTREVQRDTLRIRDSVRTHDVTIYHDVAGRIIAANPDNIPAKQIKTVADKAIASDSSRRVADSALRVTDAREIARLKAIKSMAPPRISLYGSGGYDFIQHEPVSRLGTEIRILEPLSIDAYLEARTRGSGDSTRVRFSGVVAAKVTFR